MKHPIFPYPIYERPWDMIYGKNFKWGFENNLIFLFRDIYPSSHATVRVNPYSPMPCLAMKSAFGYYCVPDKKVGKAGRNSRWPQFGFEDLVNASLRQNRDTCWFIDGLYFLVKRTYFHGLPKERQTPLDDQFDAEGG